MRYLAGPKRGLPIHFFSAAELDALFPAPDFTPVLGLRRQITRRHPPAPGQWTQWESIWQGVSGGAVLP